MFFSYPIVKTNDIVGTLRILSNNIAFFFASKDRLKIKFTQHKLSSLLKATDFYPAKNNISEETDSFHERHFKLAHCEQDDMNQEHFHLFINDTTPLILSTILQGMLACENELKTIHEGCELADVPTLDPDVINNCLNAFREYYNNAHPDEYDFSSKPVFKWLEANNHDAASSFLARKIHQDYLNKKLLKAESYDDEPLIRIDSLSTLF